MKCKEGNDDSLYYNLLGDSFMQHIFPGYPCVPGTTPIGLGIQQKEKTHIPLKLQPRGEREAAGVWKGKSVSERVT